MNPDERKVVETRVKELKARLDAQRRNKRARAEGGYSTAVPPPSDRDMARTEGNIGALEWVLREFPEPVEAKCK